MLAAVVPSAINLSSLQIVVLLTALSVLPAIIMSLTPLLRITIVLHFLRSALGTQSAPSNQVLLGLAMILTLLVLRPQLETLQSRALTPMLRGEIGYDEAWKQVEPELKGHLLRYCREKDLALFVEIGKLPPPRNPSELPVSVIMPAYVLSELRAGFQIGASIFLPFLAIDLVVASLTLSLGLVQLPPVMISGPVKIFLFVAVDGWTLLIGSLARSFYP